MTDFDFDCYQKKSVARSSSRRKCGSKSKRCSLPSDMLTQAQLKKQNGKVVSYHLREPMTWEQFKELPTDLQTEYLSGLIQSFGVTGAEVARMLGVSSAWFNRHVHSQGLNVSFKRGAKMTKAERTAWEIFLGKSLVSPNPAVPDEDPAPQAAQSAAAESAGLAPDATVSPWQDVPPAAKQKPPRDLGSLQAMNMSFKGEITVDEIANSLRLILGSAPVTGTVSIYLNLCDPDSTPGAF